MAKEPMKNCKDCGLAEWERTVTGRLSPIGRGICGWVPNFEIPICYTDMGRFAYTSQFRPTVYRNAPFNGCKAWEPIEEEGELNRTIKGRTWEGVPGVVT